MNNIRVLFVASLGHLAGCSQPSPSPPGVVRTPAPPSAAAPSVSPSASGAMQRADLTLAAGGLNGIDERTPATRAAIAAALGAGYEVRPKTIPLGEGDVIPGFAIVRDGEELAVVFPEKGLVGAIELTSASIKTEDGLRIGSSFSDLAAAKGKRKCRAIVAEGSAGECTLTDSGPTGIVYELAADFGTEQLEGAALDQKLRGRAITAIRWNKLKDRWKGKAAYAPPKVLTLDPTLGSVRVNACNGEDVTLVMPLYPGTDWVIRRQDKRLGEPKLEYAERWLGTNTHANKYTWKTSQIPTESGPDAVVELVDKADKGGAKFVASIHLFCP